MKFNKVGGLLLFFLVIYWIVAIFLIIFLMGLGVELIFYLKSDSNFYFDWLKELAYAINKAIPSGGILGGGIWIKAKLQERKARKESAK